MKKFFAILLTLCMVATMSVTAFAAEDNKTDVTYTAGADGREGSATATWTITVPPTLTTGGAEGEVKAEGFWAPSSLLTVSTDATVNMYLGGDEEADYAVVPVDFAGISEEGSYTEKVSKTAMVSVDDANAMSDIKFGEWKGTVVFNVALVNNPNYTGGNNINGGTTAPEEPIPEGAVMIATADELVAFAATTTTADTYVALTADIDLANVTWTSIADFAGTFNGQGYTISNLKDAALFSGVTETGVVKNVNLKDASASTTIGGFLVSSLNGKLEGCTVTNATATTNTYGVSGMVDFAGTTAVIDKCAVEGYTLTVTNTEDNRDKVGGLVGQSSGATITNSTVSDITLNGVYKTKEWGGFVGRHANEGLIEGCTATNVAINVSDYAQSVGGFVGATANSTIKDCYMNGVTIKVNNGGHIGGFCGYTGNATYFNFEDCHVTGLSITLDTDTVSGIGGFSGRAAFTTTIKNCSAEGTIYASETAVVGGNIKALVGQEYDGGSVYEGNTANVTIK